MASKFRDNPPHAHRFRNQAGFESTAQQHHPNGMEFGEEDGKHFHQTDTERYFTDMQNNHNRVEGIMHSDPYEGHGYPVMNWERRARIETSRFLHVPLSRIPRRGE